MWIRTSLATALALISVCLVARAEEDGLNPALTKMVQEAITTRVPKEFEDRSGWGRALPDGGGLRRARRRTVPMGEGSDLPDGLWKRTRLWFDDPAKDLQVRVYGPQRQPNGKLHVRVDVTAALHGERERQRRRNGVKLFGITTRANAVVAMGLDCEVATSMELKELLPKLRVEPTVTGVHLDLKDFDLVHVGKLLEGEQAREVGNQLKEVFQQLLRTREPDVRRYANREIVRIVSERTASFFPGLVNVTVVDPNQHDR